MRSYHPPSLILKKYFTLYKYSYLIKYSKVVVQFLLRLKSSNALKSSINSSVVVIRVYNLLIKYMISFISSCIVLRFVFNASIDGDDMFAFWGVHLFLGGGGGGKTCSCLHLWLLVKVVYTSVILLTITSLPLLPLPKSSDTSTVSSAKY